MGLRQVTARAVSVPVAKATRMSTRVLAQRDYLLVEVVDDDGATGLGFSYVGTSGGAMSQRCVEDVLAPVLADVDPGDVAGVWELMYQEALLVGRRGVVLRAISAIDIALWDLKAKRCGLPLGVLLGGTLEPLPAYASGGYYRPDDGPWAEAVGAEVELNRSQGFVDHKIKVGGLPVREDAARVAAGVAALGPGERLALDCNNAYRTAAEAERAVRAFEDAAGDVGLWWVEEPLSPEDVSGHARLADAVATPIATGEIHQTRWDFRALLEQRAADVLQPDAGVLGGVTEWMRVAHAAETYDVPLAPHWHANLHVHLVAATPGATTIEYFDLDKDIFNLERLFTEDTRLLPSDGHLRVPDRPGLGVELDEEAVAQFATGSAR